MKDSADIRKVNKHKIQRILWQGGQYTKQQIAEKTGLSIATCNTLLNAMERLGEVCGEKKRLQEVGRESVCYQINEAFESFLCVFLEIRGGQRCLRLQLLSPLGRILEQQEGHWEQLDAEVITGEIGKMRQRHSNISRIMIGTPSVAENGVIRHCDIPELEGVEIVARIEKQFAIPAYLGNDMHFMAYGYYKQYGKAEEIVTLAYFPTYVLPGTASVHAGMILQGKDQFAGMVGFLPYDMTREEQIALLQKDTCRPLVAKVIASVIAIVNPGVIVLSGDLLDESSPDWLIRQCLPYIPAEYMPCFVYEKSFERFYTEGMYQKALDLKGAVQ